MPNLYVIVRRDVPVWAKVCDAEEAEQAAIVAAVNGGMCSLLSGADLAEHLTAHVDAADSKAADERPTANPA